MKILLLTLCLLSTTISISQKFEVTQNGLVNAEKPEKRYLVIDFENKAKKKLYDKVVLYVNENYVNPDEVIVSDIENQILKFKTYEEAFDKFSNTIGKVSWNMSYNTEISFKDNKIKYEIQNVKITNDSSRELNFSGGFGTFRIFTNSGKLKMDDAKKGIEKYFNQNVDSLTEYINDDQSSDDW